VTVAQIPQPEEKKVGLDDYIVGGGRLAELQTFALSAREFRPTSFWYGQWKLKLALAA
jgi:hypothetical protein